MRVNAALQRIVGLDLAAMLGRTVREVVPGKIGAFADSRLREVIPWPPGHRRRPRGRLPTGSADRSLVVSYFRLEGPDGTVLGAASIVSDVGDQHRTRRALERANARLALLGRAAGVLNASLDLEETLSGLGRLLPSSREIADHCVVDLVEPDDGPAASGRRRAATVRRRPRACRRRPGAVRRRQTPWPPVGGDVRYPPGHPVARRVRPPRGLPVRTSTAIAFDFEAVAPEPGVRAERPPTCASAAPSPFRAAGARPRWSGILSLIDSISGRRQGDEDSNTMLKRRHTT